MTILFRPSNVDIAEAVRRLRGDPWFQAILKQMEKTADEEGHIVAYPNKDGPMHPMWHAGRLSLAMEFIDCFTSEEGR